MTDPSPSLPARLAGLPADELAPGLWLVEASSFASRQRGLGGLAALAPGVALEIRGSAVHTFTMRFPLDLIWLGRDGGVLRVDAVVPRGRVRVCRRARTVIETNAGEAATFLAALGLA